MPYDPAYHRRRSIRLKDFDYRTPGLYVVTICTQHRTSLFGEIIDGQMHRNSAGDMVQTVWDELPWVYPGVEIDAFVVMPNHVHGIVFLLPEDLEAGQGQARGQGQALECAPTGDVDSVGASPCGRPHPEKVAWVQGQARGQGQVQGQGQARGPAPTGGVGSTGARLSLPDVVHRFKSLTTNRYGDGVRECGWMPYDRRLWQRNYYEHIVRNEYDLQRFRRYIVENPIRWIDDRHHPAKPEMK